MLFALYGGYVALRALSTDTRSMRTIAAILGVIACVDIPLIHFAVKYWGGLHPVVQREGGGGLDPAMASSFALSMLAFLLLFCLLFWINARLRLGALRIDELHLEIADLAYDRPAAPRDQP